MVGALFDTNILIDYLGGVGAAKKELARYDYRAVSTVMWMEVLVGATSEDEAAIRAWLLARTTPDNPPVVSWSLCSHVTADVDQDQRLRCG